MIELMMSACVGAAMMTGQPAQDEPAQIMVEFRLLDADLTTERTWVIPTSEDRSKPSIRFDKNGMMELGSEGLRFTSMRATNWHFTLTDAGTIDVAGWRYVVGGPNEGLGDSPFTLVSTPRVLVLDGQEAMISIGQAVEYLEPTDEEGTFRVVTSDDASEGIAITVTPRLRPDGTILLDPVEFEFREVASREPVEGLNLQNVGKPVMRTVSQSASVVVAQDETVMIPVKHSDFEKRPMFLFVRPRLVKESVQPAQNENAPAEEAGAPVQDLDSLD
ncbi:MAG: hypothetical protein ACF8MJ_04500 [Phycisphaerales bacterium JB050]